MTHVDSQKSSKSTKRKISDLLTEDSILHGKRAKYASCMSEETSSVCLQTTPLKYGQELPFHTFLEPFSPSTTIFKYEPKDMFRCIDHDKTTWDCISLDDFSYAKKSFGSGKFGKIYLLTYKKTGQTFIAKLSIDHTMNKKERTRSIDTYPSVLLINEYFMQRDCAKVNSNIVKPLALFTTRSFHDSSFQSIIQHLPNPEERDRITQAQVISSEKPKTGTKFCTLVIMEYYESLNLYKYMSNTKLKKAITIPLVAQISKQLIHALQTCSLNGIIHRDVKSENILISKAGYTVKLIDFGLSIRVGPGPHATCSKSGIGTLEFMSPQVLDPLNCGAYTYKTDIWSFGVVVFELLFGRTPFEYESSSTRLNQEKSDIVKKIRSMDIQWPKHLSYTKDSHLKQAVNFLESIFVKEETKRSDWEDLLLHPFLKITNP
jgi:serine/threonine protein kinase